MIPLLVVGTSVAGAAAARIPRALARAGGEVVLLVPERALACATRHARRIGRVPAGAPPDRWVEALLAAIAATEPRALVAADAGAWRLLASLPRFPGVRADLARAAADRLAASLGPLPDTLDAIDAAGRARLHEAGVPLASADDTSRATLRVDAVAHAGRLLAAVGVEPCVGDAPGRATVVRFVGAPDAERVASAAVAALGLAGWCSFDFADGEPGEPPRLLAIERHLSSTMHRAAWAGVDLAGAWLAALGQRAWDGATSLAPGPARTSVDFPGEWRRDRASRWLREHPVDVPWDDPELLDAIVAGVVGGAPSRAGAA